MLEIRLLGTFDLRQAGKPIAISSRPAQSLFAYLILTAGTPHRREKLAGLLWPDSLEETARDNLRHALWRVRKAIQSASVPCNLKANDLAISFDILCEYWFDVAILEKLNGTESADELIAVLSGYKGELLPGFYEDWVVLEREHLNSIFEHNMARLMSLLQNEKRWLDILDWGERWIKLGHRPEPAYRALMAAHATKGDMSKVVATYKRCVKALKELGVEPSEQTHVLYERLKTGKGTLETESIPPTKEARIESTKTNLPTPLTSFIGREKEVEEIILTVGKNRLVTLTGPGGVGKTRLAIQSSIQMIDNFKNGVWWVELAPLTDEALIPQVVAQSLGVRESPTQPLMESLKNFLREKQLLLILDNCEHIIDACAQVAHDMLTQCANLRILATSREALDIMGEFEYQVQPLTLPIPERLSLVDLLIEYEGIRLFVERANAKSGFNLTEQNANAVFQICQRLDGIPLALELAAARTTTLSVEQIAERLNDRFNLLTQGNRTALPRHQTLRALIDWSYDLLSENEQAIFRRLAVFAGDWALGGAKTVCSGKGVDEEQILDLLSFLVDKSLVIMQERDREVRYKMLETIRQYALERLAEVGEEKLIREQHSEFFLMLVEESEPFVFGRDSAIWIKRLFKELDNIRAAIEWSTHTGNAIVALRYLGALVNFWFVYGPLSEWHHRVRQALALPGGMERTSARSKVLSGFGFLYWTNNYPFDVRSELEEALAIAIELKDQRNVALAYFNLGLLASLRGTFEETRSYFVQALKIWRETVPMHKMEIGRTLMCIGDAALTHDEMEQARSSYEEAMGVWKDFGDKNLLAYSIRRLGQLEWREGNFEKATRLYKESLILNQGTADQRGVLACLSCFSAAAADQENFQRAIILFTAVESHLISTGTRLLPVDRMEYDRSLDLLSEKLEEKLFDKYREIGKNLSLGEAIELALEGT
jgi:predicted ATPase/DNA-binding SARP family transcriptional activator